jgi:hypothetical protein
MSTAATLTIFTSPNGSTTDTAQQIIRGTVVIPAGTYPAGGYTLAWGGIEAIKALAPVTPLDVTFKSVGSYAGSPPVAVGNPTGYDYLWDIVNGNLHIFQSDLAGSPPSAPKTEFTTGETIPTAVVNDYIMFTAVFFIN